MDIRFKKDSYLADIAALRAEVKRNGAKGSIAAVRLSHPSIAGQPTVYLNLAYQPDAGKAKADASLYIVGFGNDKSTKGAAGTAPGWGFNLPSLSQVAGRPATALPGHCDGNYIHLGHSDKLPEITDQGLATYIMRLYKYDGGVANQDLYTALAAIMVAVSEAARFTEVAHGVDAVLGTDGRYAPPVDLVRAWGGHTLGA